jgi:cellobiose phosphorylase
MYHFIDNKGTFTVHDPRAHELYFPLTNKTGTLLSSISPNLAGDIKHSNDSFVTPPASIEDIRSNLLCRRDFFIKIDNATVRLSQKPYDSLECGFLYHKITKNIGTLAVEIINFVPHDLDVEVMWINIKNKSNKTVKITPTSFIPLYGRTSENIRDHRHVSSLLNRIKLNRHGIILKPSMIFNEKGHALNKTTYFSFGWEDNGKAPIGQFPTLDYFCGSGDLINPEAIEAGVSPITKHSPDLDGKEAVAALRFKTKQIKPHQETNYCLITGFTKGRSSENILKNLDSVSKIKISLEKTKNYWQQYLQGTDYDFKNNHLNNWLRWVKFQPTLRKLFGCSFLPHFDYGKGGRGWRDLWQDALALLINEPAQAKQLIHDSFKGVRIDGSNATIITEDGLFLSDRNNINRVWMDHGIWPYITLNFYIHKTGDINILTKNMAYFQDHLFSRGKEIDISACHKDLILRTKNKEIYKGSTLEHVLLELLIPFFNVGSHNIIRLEGADWNDGLDMAKDRGESACFSNMYAHHLKDICSLLKHLKTKTRTVSLLKDITLLLDSLHSPINYNSCKEKQERLKQYYEASKNLSGKKVNIDIDLLIRDLSKKADHLSKWLKSHEYLKPGFFNGYYDNSGKQVEGKKGKQINMMLASQVFAIMGGTAEDEQIKKIWKTINKYLKNPNHAGFRLNTDFKKPYLDLGRAFGFSYGDKENGAFFNHMVIMLAYALYKRDFRKEAYEVLDSIYKMSISPNANIYPLIPEYFNNQGKGLYLYLTGSASWYIYTLVEQMLGIKAYFGDILIEPKLCPDQFLKNSIGLTLNFYGKILNIEYIKPNQTSKTMSVEKVLLNKRTIATCNGKLLIKKSDLKGLSKKIKVTIYLK